MANLNKRIGEALQGISRGDMRRQIRYNEETGDFEIVDSDTPLEEGIQNVTDFASEGFA